jgi:hypothetical protein
LFTQVVLHGDDERDYAFLLKGGEVSEPSRKNMAVMELAAATDRDSLLL